MATFLCANVVGIGLFAAVPFFFGRAVMSLLASQAATGTFAGLPAATWFLWLVHGGQAFSREAKDAAPAAVDLPLVADALAGAPELPVPGQSALVDLLALALGYAGLAAALATLVPCALLLGAALGWSTQGPQLMRVGVGMALAQARQGLVSAWLKLQILAVVVLQLLLMPCYIGHLVVCMLCGPVLHLPQHARASMANANMPLTLVMQLFIGYVHLWGVAFLEGCIADVFVPTVIWEAVVKYVLVAYYII